MAFGSKTLKAEVHSENYLWLNAASKCSNQPYPFEGLYIYMTCQTTPAQYRIPGTLTKTSKTFMGASSDTAQHYLDAGPFSLAGIELKHLECGWEVQIPLLDVWCMRILQRLPMLSCTTERCPSAALSHHTQHESIMDMFFSVLPPTSHLFCQQPRAWLYYDIVQSHMWCKLLHTQCPVVLVQNREPFWALQQTRKQYS